MSISFETLGNATIIMYEDGKPQLATDPWMVGTCYYGSWALEKPLSEADIDHIKQCKYVWFSHGHPDHLHIDSVNMLERSTILLVPDLYKSEIPAHLEGMGFTVRVLKYREWFPVTDRIRICCIDNINQDAILAIDTDEGLIINKNDSPFCGELRFLRSLVRKHPRHKTYMTSLYAGAGDMENQVDAMGNRVIGAAKDRQLSKVLKVTREADRLGIGTYCCSSSQHVYVRADTVWANEYGLHWKELKRRWNRPAVDLVPPFVTIDIAAGGVTYHADAPEIIPYDVSGTGDDDWSETLDEAEWKKVFEFFQKYETLRGDVDIIGVTIGGERRDVPMNDRAFRVPRGKLRIAHFIAPKNSFMDAVTWGYFDDLMIGNFMKTELVNMSLYPNFTPKLAKYGGNAKVFTNRDLAAFRWHYFRRNPYAYMAMRTAAWFNNVIVGGLRTITEKIGLKLPFKWVYRTVRGDTITGGAGR
jgi:hypothetical protein